MSTCATMWIYNIKSPSTRSKATMASPLRVKANWTKGLGRTHDVWLYLLGLGIQMAFPRKSTKSPSLTRPYLLEDATPDNLPYTKELTICSYRMAWHCYIPLPTFPRPVVRYAYRYSIKRRSRLTVIILDLSKRRRGWDVAAQRSF